MSTSCGISQTSDTVVISVRNFLELRLFFDWFSKNAINTNNTTNIEEKIVNGDNEYKRWILSIYSSMSISLIPLYY